VSPNIPEQRQYQKDIVFFALKKRLVDFWDAHCKTWMSDRKIVLVALEEDSFVFQFTPEPLEMTQRSFWQQ
jgi:hypothetical protein